MKNFRSPYDHDLKLKMPNEDDTALCFIMRGAKNDAGVQFY